MIAQSSQENNQLIRALVDTWLTASKRGDVATLQSLLADDVIFITPGREPFGKEAFTANDHGPVLKEATSDIQEIEVLGDWAWMRTYLDLLLSSSEGGLKRYAGYTLTILKKNSQGQWVISRDANLVMPKE
ncbi:MAG: SgcJ/EcaC family oxidoreductase [Pyrinomonadaceae bacterium]